MEKMGWIKGYLGIGLGAGALFLQARAAGEEKPNILWITIEDTSPQFVGFYGNGQVKTPNIDKLAREGVIFNNAFATAPVCAPSRFTLITGINPGQGGTGNMRTTLPIPSTISGFPYYLRQIGYYTTNNQKTDYNIKNEGAFVTKAWNASGKNAGWSGRSSGQPFFSVYNYNECHQSATMTNPWRWYEQYVLAKLPADKITDPQDIAMPPIYRDTEPMRRYYSRVYNSLNLTDVQVGTLINSLKSSGLMESTIIFFFGDNGEGIPRGKSSSIGMSYHVPFFIWFPDQYKHLSPWEIGKSTNELVCFEDFAPTLLSLTGAPIPEYMTGRPFLGSAREEPVQHVFGMRDRIGDSPDLVRTATDGRYFYMRVFFPRYPNLKWQKYADVSDIVRTIKKDHKNGLLNQNQSLMLEPRKHELLYDLQADPWELNNLAGNPVYAAKLEELRVATRNRALWNKDIMFLPEYELSAIAATGIPYDYRTSGQYNHSEVIHAAWEATDPATTPQRLFEMLQDPNPVIGYWAAVGIHSNLSLAQLNKESLLTAMRGTYPPKAIEAAAMVWENYGETEAKTKLKSFVLDKNNWNAMQALHMLEYMENVTEDMLDAVATALDKRSRAVEGYENEFSVVSCCETVLYMYRNRPLYIEEFKQWTEGEYLSVKMQADPGKLMVCPNPAHNDFTLKMDEIPDKLVSVAISDSSGKTIVSEIHQHFGGPLQLKYSLPSNGFYIVKLNAGQRVYHSKLIIH
jgi:arylsulfatase A-like enzyme